MRIDQPINREFFLDTRLRFFVLALMVIAFMFGFADQVWDKNFERLHIFLFNLCAGGFTILYHTENTPSPSPRCYLFLALSLAYALLAFLQIYPAAALTSFSLGSVVETSVLCLSLALFIATFVLLNDTSLHWLPYKNLTLNVFFLGYSFPVSLITMSVMFSFIRRDITQPLRYIKQSFFWLVNLGVIIFFLFIIFELAIAKFLIATILFITVLMIFSFFLLLGVNLQQKYFLLSGMTFLVFTGITGIFYIELANYPDLYYRWGRVLLDSHAYLSLYGWSLSGLLILIRWNDFPLKLNSWAIITFHWLVVGILAPLGKNNVLIAVVSLISYCLFLHLFFAENNAARLTEKAPQNHS
jgi:hypothetical protein